MPCRRRFFADVQARRCGQALLDRIRANGNSRRTFRVRCCDGAWLSRACGAGFCPHPACAAHRHPSPARPFGGAQGIAPERGQQMCRRNACAAAPVNGQRRSGVCLPPFAVPERRRRPQYGAPVMALEKWSADQAHGAVEPSLPWQLTPRLRGRSGLRSGVDKLKHGNVANSL